MIYSRTPTVSFLDRVVRIAAFLSGLAILVVTLIISFDVLMRYFLNKPQLFVDEVASFLLLFIALAGMAETFKKGGHIKVDLVTNFLNPRAKRILRFCTLLVGITFLAVVTWNTAISSIIAYRQERISAVILFPLWIPMLSIPLGLALMGLNMGNHLIKEFRAVSDGGIKESSPGEESPDE